MMIFELEYEVTLEDEINALEVTNEYIGRLPLFHWQQGYLVPLMFLFLDLPYFWQFLNHSVALDTNFQVVSNLVFALLTLPQIRAKLPIYTWISKSQRKQSWLNNPEQIKARKIIVTDTEFTYSKTECYMFLEEQETKSYQWGQLTRYLESDRGFVLEFQNQKERCFIPKRILTDTKKLTRLREILHNSTISD